MVAATKKSVIAIFQQFPKGKNELFFLAWADERMKQSGDGVGFFGAEDPFVHVPHILDREERMGIC